MPMKHEERGLDVEEILIEDRIEDAILNENASENDNEEYVEVNEVILNASFKESVNKGTNVAKEEVHNNEETSSKKSDDLLLNIEGKEDILLANRETSNKGLNKDNVRMSGILL